MVTDRDLLNLLSCQVFEAPAVLASRAGRKRINLQLGRLHRQGLLERVPGPRSFLYRSRQMALGKFPLVRAA